MLLDEAATELEVLSHVGRPDDEIHGLGEGEVLLIVQGSHGYISPGWYAPGVTRVPTWNFTVAHCYGVPQILAPEENLRELHRLVQHFEHRLGRPSPLDPAVSGDLSKGTVGYRLPITRFVCKVKLSQDKDPESRRGVIAGLRTPGPYANRRLAEDMENAGPGD